MIPLAANVILPAPDALPLPAPAFLMRLLLLLTFYLHLLAMNAMLGGVIITFWARLRRRETGDAWDTLADAVAGTTPALVAATVTLGVAPLLFLQTLMGQFFFTSSILMGWGWFSVVVVLIFAYYGTYLQSFKRDRLGSARTPLLLGTAVLFLWIAFMFSNNTSLMAAVTTWPGKYFSDARGLHLNLDDPTLVPRYLHAILGAVAVAGLMLALWGRRRLTGGDSSGTFMVRTGLAAFTWTTLVNLLVGSWYLMALPRDAMLQFMGGSPVGTVLLTVGLVLGILMVVLGQRARNLPPGTGLMPVTVLTAVVMAAMVLMRDMARGAVLADLYRPGDFAVKTQVLNLVLFAGLLVGGIAIVVWMVRKLQKAWN
ncbi:MAG: hypothetical protein ABFS42_02135 [Candidatus Krumholzibacteriota bacterium]